MKRVFILESCLMSPELSLLSSSLAQNKFHFKCDFSPKPSTDLSQTGSKGSVSYYYHGLRFSPLTVGGRKR